MEGNMDKYVITISRQFASLGRSIAQELSELLDIEFYDRDIVEATAKRMGLKISSISKEEEIVKSKFFKRKYPLGTAVANIQDEIFNVQKNIIQDIAKKESCIIVGRCGNEVLKDFDRSLHIYIYASDEDRLDNCINVLQMDSKVAKKMIKEVDKARDKYRLKYCSEVKHVHDGYDLLIDSSRFGVENSAKIIASIIKDMFD